MANGIHSSFNSIWVGTYPLDSTLPTSFTDTGFAKIPDLISAGITGPSNTQVDDSEQESLFKEFFPGRGDPLVVTAKFTYKLARHQQLYRFLPGPLNARTYPSNGRYMWQFVRPDGVKIRTLGYLQITNDDVPEDDRMTIDISIQGSGVPLIVTDGNVQLPGGTAGSPPPPPPPP